MNLIALTVYILIFVLIMKGNHNYSDDLRSDSCDKRIYVIMHFCKKKVIIFFCLLITMVTSSNLKCNWISRLNYIIYNIGGTGGTGDTKNISRKSHFVFVFPTHRLCVMY